MVSRSLLACARITAVPGRRRLLLPTSPAQNGVRHTIRTASPWMKHTTPRERRDWKLGCLGGRQQRERVCLPASAASFCFDLLGLPLVFPRACRRATLPDETPDATSRHVPLLLRRSAIRWHRASKTPSAARSARDRTPPREHAWHPPALLAPVARVRTLLAGFGGGRCVPDDRALCTRRRRSIDTGRELFPRPGRDEKTRSRLAARRARALAAPSRSCSSCSPRARPRPRGPSEARSK